MSTVGVLEMTDKQTKSEIEKEFYDKFYSFMEKYRKEKSEFVSKGMYNYNILVEKYEKKLGYKPNTGAVNF